MSMEHEEHRIIRRGKPRFGDGFDAGVNISKVAGTHWNPFKLETYGFWFPVISFGTTALIVGGFALRASLGAIGGAFGQQVNASAPLEMQIGNSVGYIAGRTIPVVFNSVSQAGNQATRAVLVSNNWAGKNTTQFVNISPVQVQSQTALDRWEGQR